ncbi:MAG: hypothetical protein M5U01_23895 [Ardenticatenaceae bacterium]|nr:hypothetical protein [Ardenticatenaceae bacterium]
MNPRVTSPEQRQKAFDAVAMKRRIQEQIYEDTKGMTPEVLIAYFHRRITESEFASFLTLPGVPPPGQSQSEAEPGGGGN